MWHAHACLCHITHVVNGYTPQNTITCMCTPYYKHTNDMHVYNISNIWTTLMHTLYHTCVSTLYNTRDKHMHVHVISHVINGYTPQNTHQPHVCAHYIKTHQSHVWTHHITCTPMTCTCDHIIHMAITYTSYYNIPPRCVHIILYTYINHMCMHNTSDLNQSSISG